MFQPSKFLLQDEHKLYKTPDISFTRKLRSYSGVRSLHHEQAATGLDHTVTCSALI